MKRSIAPVILACAAAALAATGCSQSGSGPAEPSAPAVSESAAEASDSGEGIAEPEMPGEPEMSDGDYYTDSPVLHFGTILSADPESGDISMDIAPGDGVSRQEVIFHSIGSVPIVDAMTGLPVSMSDLAEGQEAYAWSSPAMTMSIPAQTSLQAMAVNVPEGTGAPAYVVAASAEYDEAEGSLTITDQDGNEYTAVEGEADIQPFKTRNIVTLRDVAAGSRMMVWDDVTRIVLF